MTVFLSGKITGDPDYKENFRRGEIIARIDTGCHVILNPAKLPEGLSNKDYMKICFEMIDASDLVVFLPGHEESNGSLLEKCYCEYINKEYREYYTLKGEKKNEWNLA